MNYDVFISTTDDKQSQQYLQTIKTALWRIQEIPLVPITMEDFVINPNVENPLVTIQRILDEAEIFIGIYGEHYGQIPVGYEVSHLELEYDYAQEKGLPTLIFIPENLKTAKPDSGDIHQKQMNEFRQRLITTNVVHFFSSMEDLSAKVVVGINTAKKQIKQSKPPQPPPSTFRSAITDAKKFDNDVQRAYQLIEDDLENLIQRALEVHHAQQTLQEDNQPTEGMLLQPIFGQPSTRSQFRSDIFMIMPFRDNFNIVYEEKIKPIVKALNLTIKRGDDFSSTTGSIIQEVWAAIYNCRLVIVEATEVNANVYYELGIAHTLGKPAILITQAEKLEDLPFDLRHRRFIHYSNTIAGGRKLEQELRQMIIWILNDLDELKAENE